MTDVDDAIARATQLWHPRHGTDDLAPERAFEDRRILAAEVKRLQEALDRWVDRLGDAWDDGNATGLDGWVGPGRGMEPDEYAIRARERYIEKKMGALASGDEVQS